MFRPKAVRESGRSVWRTLFITRVICLVSPVCVIMLQRQTLIVCQSKEFALLLTGGCVCLPTLRFHYVQPAGWINVVSLYNAVFVWQCVCVCVPLFESWTEGTRSSVCAGCPLGLLLILLHDCLCVCMCVSGSIPDCSRSVQTEEAQGGAGLFYFTAGRILLGPPCRRWYVTFLSLDWVHND